MIMTQEEKELLLKDLCARLPYKVKVHVMGTTRIFDICILLDTMSNRVEVKPYFRSMSSMTEEEEKEYFEVIGYKGEDENGWVRCDNIYTEWGLWLDGCTKLLDWLNAHHFDYRGLIEKGLAIEAPEGMYGKGKQQ